MDEPVNRSNDIQFYTNQPPLSPSVDYAMRYMAIQCKQCNDLIEQSERMIAFINGDKSAITEEDRERIKILSNARGF